MRKSICMPMKASARHDNRSVDTSPSITQGDLMQPLTDAPPIRPTSTRCRSARQLNPRPTTPLSDAEILFKEPGPPHSQPMAFAPFLKSIPTSLEKVGDAV